MAVKFVQSHDKWVWRARVNYRGHRRVSYHATKEAACQAEQDFYIEVRLAAQAASPVPDTDRLRLLAAQAAILDADRPLRLLPLAAAAERLAAAAAAEERPLLTAAAERLTAAAERLRSPSRRTLEARLGPAHAVIPATVRGAPIVYAVVSVGGLVRYIGTSRRGLERPMKREHRALADLAPDDQIFVWTYPTSEAAYEAEQGLIAAFVPQANRAVPSVSRVRIERPAG